MRLIACCILAVIFSAHLNAQSIFSHGRLKVTSDGHYLQFADGKPFFLVG